MDKPFTNYQRATYRSFQQWIHQRDHRSRQLGTRSASRAYPTGRTFSSDFGHALPTLNERL